VALTSDRLAAWFDRHPFALFLSLYAAIAAVAALAWGLLPGPLHEAIHALTGGAGLGAGEALFSKRELAALPPPAAPAWATATLAMASAALLALPLAWLYTITRHKRGYRQSVVQTLILLPVIVAGVVVLVKFNLALAFSLAGIVAAVRFRNTLEDSKDAVYIFAATGIGLSAGVDLSAAATLSFGYNLVTLLLYRSDFGRTPSPLSGAVAEERLRKALEEANRTGEFVSRVDHEILESMSPQQLDALADRAFKRHRDAAADTGEDDKAKYDCVLAVRTDGSSGARLAVETILLKSAKRWHFQSEATAEDGAQRIEYALRLKKSASPSAFLDALRAQGTAGVRDVELL
jgi:uncharacterized membrane protein YhiD involved in acid resistance